MKHKTYLELLANDSESFNEVMRGQKTSDLILLLFKETYVEIGLLKNAILWFAIFQFLGFLAIGILF